MIDDLPPEQLAEVQSHVFAHLYDTALCLLGSDEAIDTAGLTVQFEDVNHTWWTFTVIPSPVEKEDE